MNAPNPVDTRRAGLAGETAIGWHLTEDSRVSLTLYDLFGRRVQTWNFTPGQEGGRAGANEIFWDGANEAGQKVSKGGYIAEIEVQTPQTTARAIRKIGVIH